MAKKKGSTLLLVENEAAAALVTETPQPAEPVAMAEAGEVKPKGKRKGTGAGAKVLEMAPVVETPAEPESAGQADAPAVGHSFADDVAAHRVSPGDVSDVVTGETATLPASLIIMDPADNGRPLNPKKVKEYAADFAARIAAGLEPQLQEIGVQPWREVDGGPVSFRVVFGFHRMAAVLLYNETAEPGHAMHVRCRILAPNTAYGRLMDNYTENAKHNALDPVSMMGYMLKLRDEHGMNGKQIAKALGVSTSAVSQRMAMEVLPKQILDGVRSGSIPVRAAYVMAGMTKGQRDKAYAALVGVADAAGDAEQLGKIKAPRLAAVQAVAAGAVDGGGQLVPEIAPVEKPRTTKQVLALVQDADVLAKSPGITKKILKTIGRWINRSIQDHDFIGAIIKAVEDPTVVNIADTVKEFGELIEQKAGSKAGNGAQTQTQTPPIVPPQAVPASAPAPAAAAQ